ncbi:MAG: efflux RND transporter periplasmic adaptor subunit, partial [Polyangiales bacterium]
MDVEEANRSTRPPAGRFGWLALIGVALASAAIALGAVLWVQRAPTAEVAPEDAASRFVCPMHPSVVQDHAGTCPICSMKLVSSDDAPHANAPAAHAEAAAEHAAYVCPMHPEVTADEPGSCPKCGMPLEPSTQQARGADAATTYVCPMHPEVVQDHPGDCPLCAMALVPREAHAPDAAHGAEGLADVQIDPTRQQLIGLHTAEVKRGSVGGAWRTVGRVAVDETRLRTINLKVSGYIERVYANFVGKVVAEGEPLFSVYSPDLLAAQEELLLALRTQRDLETAEALALDGRSLLAAARRKLQLWDVSARDLRHLERTRTPTKSLTFRSPIAGVITKKSALEGARVEAGAQLYEVIDLSEVWVLADVYESEL